MEAELGSSFVEVDSKIIIEKCQNKIKQLLDDREYRISIFVKREREDMKLIWDKYHSSTLSRTWLKIDCWFSFGKAFDINEYNPQDEQKIKERVAFCFPSVFYSNGEHIQVCTKILEAAKLKPSMFISANDLSAIS